jgi:hypothetical protein
MLNFNEFVTGIKIQREVSKTNSPLSYLNPTKPCLKYFSLRENRKVIPNSYYKYICLRKV